VLAKVLVWLKQGGSGEKRQITLSGPYEQDVWVRLSAEDEGCNLEVCQNAWVGYAHIFKPARLLRGRM